MKLAFGGVSWAARPCTLMLDNSHYATCPSVSYRAKLGAEACAQTLVQRLAYADVCYWYASFVDAASAASPPIVHIICVPLPALAKRASMSAGANCRVIEPNG